MGDDIDDILAGLRASIEGTKGELVNVLQNGFFRNESPHLDGANIPISQHANMEANITLAFRHLEDARMRIGKVLQAYQGGISIFDRNAGDTSNE